MHHPENKHERNILHRHKLRALYEKTKRYYGVGVYYDSKKNRLVKYSLNSASLRTVLNRIFRRQMKVKDIETDAGIYPPGFYRKAKDYWWELM